MVEEENTQPTLLRGLAALKTELARLTQALEESERLRSAETAERVTAQSFLKAAQERAAQFEREIAELRGAQAQVPAIEEQVHSLSRRLAKPPRPPTRRSRRSPSCGRRSRSPSSAPGRRTPPWRRCSANTPRWRRSWARRSTPPAPVAKRRPPCTPRSPTWRRVPPKLGELQTALAAADAARTETEAVIARLRQELVATHEQRSRAEAALEQTSAALAASEQEQEQLGKSAMAREPAGLMTVACWPPGRPERLGAGGANGGLRAHRGYAMGISSSA
ncbi:MAG: hypothetical protein U0802_00845 [Candidatus Binatia bacterium]